MAPRRIAIAKVLVFCACLAPLAWLVARGAGVAPTGLGPNPVEEVLHTLGKTGLNILMITLAVTPARLLSGVNALVRFRRMLGLFSFFYVLLHFLSYAVLDLGLAWSTLFVDITQRPYITVGMLALAGMIPLAVTSTKAMQRRMGRRWVKLHRLIYPIAVLALVHYFWQTKADLFEPMLYAAALTGLLGYRLGRSLRRRRRTRRAARPPETAPAGPRA